MNAAHMTPELIAEIASEVLNGKTRSHVDAARILAEFAVEACAYAVRMEEHVAILKAELERADQRYQRMVSMP